MFFINSCLDERLKRPVNFILVNLQSPSLSRPRVSQFTASHLHICRDLKKSNWNKLSRLRSQYDVKTRDQAAELRVQSPKCYIFDSRAKQNPH